MLELTVKAKNRDRVVARLWSLRQTMLPDSPAIRLALTQAALLLQSQIKLEIRKQRLIDTGRLLNSIKWEFYKPPGGGIGVRVGSYGVPYAAIWEFGAQNFKEQVKPHTRTITQAFGKDLGGAVTVNVGPFVRTRNVRARPYMRPAMEHHRDRLIDLLRQAIAAEAAKA